MIEVDGVDKRFGAVKVLNGLSLRANDGKITALLGANGSGKTTLLRLLVGLLKQDAGHIHVGGVDPGKDPARVRSGIGFVTDQFGLYERLSTYEYLFFFAELHGMPKAEIAPRIDELSVLLELGKLLSRPLKGFSQGERIKVSLARSVLHRPKHLLLDEPTRGLDVMSTRALRRALMAMRHDGCCILMATHIMQEVNHICDDVIMMSKGRAIAQGTPSQLCDQAETNSLEDAFVQLTGSGEGIVA